MAMGRPRTKHHKHKGFTHLHIDKQGHNTPQECWTYSLLSKAEAATDRWEGARLITAEDLPEVEARFG